MAEGFTDDVDQQGRPVAQKRPQHTQEYLRTVYACGERREHRVLIHRSKWPPKPLPGLTDRPHVAANCERCGAVCIVYDPVPSDMTVVLFGAKGEEVGRVEEQGAVVDEETLEPVGGQVVDEPEPRRGRR